MSIDANAQGESVSASDIPSHSERPDMPAPPAPAGGDGISRRDYEELRAYVNQLERYNIQLENRLSAYTVVSEDVTAAIAESAPELEDTLRNMIGRLAQIMQAEKAVFMLLDEAEQALIAQKPAHGLTEREIKVFRAGSSEGISGEVFVTGSPVAVPSARDDARWESDVVVLLRVRDSLTVPLIVTRKDDIPKKIGVLHVLNKLRPGGFNDEDTHLLTNLARQLTALIQNTRIFQNLFEEKTELETTLQHMAIGVLVLDHDRRILLTNPIAERIMGVKFTEASGKLLEDAVKGEKLRDLMLKTFEDGTPGSGEIVIHSPEETIFQVQTVGGGLGTDVGVVTTFTDITRIKLLERMKTEFVSTVSHELRTPLTSIKGFTSTLLADEAGDFDAEARREFYGIIDEECDRLTRLISDLLTISRIEAGKALELKMESMQMKPLCIRVVERYRNATDTHVLEEHVPDDLPALIADKDKLDQVITNLIGNAIKYSPKGGTITLSGSKTDDQVTISITDQGMGIPPEHLDKIFDKFHRVENSDARQQEGAGIGLYLVKHLVKAHGGDVWVESTPGEGSTFFFTIPIPKTMAGAGAKS